MRNGITVAAALVVGLGTAAPAFAFYPCKHHYKVGVVPMSGGFVNTGGFVSTGGFVATGGFVPTGGFVSSGGFVPSGGFVNTGGFVPSGGFVNTGGFIPTGGFVGSGGFTANTGGFTADGGLVLPAGAAGELLRRILSQGGCGGTGGTGDSASVLREIRDELKAIRTGVWGDGTTTTTPPTGPSIPSNRIPSGGFGGVGHPGSAIDQAMGYTELAEWAAGRALVKVEDAKAQGASDAQIQAVRKRLQALSDKLK
jgi:hypothetical protein